jgi:hypothetical protein
LGSGEQLRKAPVSPPPSGVEVDCGPESSCHCDCSVVACPGLVCNTEKHECGVAFTDSKFLSGNPIYGAHARTVPQQKVETLVMENLWFKKLERLGWSETASKWVHFAWADSTRCSYDIAINKLASYCEIRGINFPPTQSADIADYLCWLAGQSNKPSSHMNTASASVTHLYKCLDMDNVLESAEIKLLIQGLIKAGTTEPICKSKVMPVKAFHDVFVDWPDNDQLAVKDLRLKTIALLGLTAMLRPSDIAPKSIVYE